MASVAAPQTNGATHSSPPQINGTAPAPTQPSQSQQPPPVTPTTLSGPGAASTAPRPRDQRTLELLLTAQGVTSFEARVPLLLLDFAYRHTSSILSDAIHLSADPQIGGPGTGKAGGNTAGGGGGGSGEPNITPNAAALAIQARLGYSFRGGGGGGPNSGNAGANRDFLANLAQERNKTALPRVPPHEWGVRLPSERFVFSGVPWGLRDTFTMNESDDEDEVEGTGGGKMEGIEGQAQEGADDEDVGGDGVEGGTIEDIFGDGVDGGEDEEMEET